MNHRANIYGMKKNWAVQGSSAFRLVGVVADRFKPVQRRVVTNSWTATKKTLEHTFFGRGIWRKSRSRTGLRGVAAGCCSKKRAP